MNTWPTFNATAMVGYRQTPGNLGASIATRDIDAERLDRDIELVDGRSLHQGFCRHWPAPSFIGTVGLTITRRTTAFWADTPSYGFQVDLEPTVIGSRAAKEYSTAWRRGREAVSNRAVVPLPLRFRPRGCQHSPSVGLFGHPSRSEHIHRWLDDSVARRT
jgi:hypothetical protein